MEMERSTRRFTCYLLALILLGIIFPLENNVAFDAIDMARNLVSVVDERNVTFLVELVSTGRYDYHAKVFAEFYQLDDTLEELIRIRDMLHE